MDFRNVCSVKKVFLKILQNFTGKICSRASFSIKLYTEACNFIKNETLAQVFCCEFCEIFKNTFFIDQLCWLLLKLGSTVSEGALSEHMLHHRTLWTAASEIGRRYHGRHPRRRALQKY